MFYRSGEIFWPRNIPVRMMLAELDFFQIPFRHKEERCEYSTYALAVKLRTLMSDIIYEEMKKDNTFVGFVVYEQPNVDGIEIFVWRDSVEGIKVVKDYENQLLQLSKETAEHGITILELSKQFNQRISRYIQGLFGFVQLECSIKSDINNAKKENHTYAFNWSFY